MACPWSFLPLYERAVYVLDEETGGDDFHVLHFSGTQLSEPPAEGYQRVPHHPFVRRVLHGREQGVHGVIIRRECRRVGLRVMPRHVPDEVFGGLQFQGVAGIMRQYLFQFRAVFPGHFQGFLEQGVVRAGAGRECHAACDGRKKDVSFHKALSFLCVFVAGACRSSSSASSFIFRTAGESTLARKAAIRRAMSRAFPPSPVASYSFMRR